MGKYSKSNKLRSLTIIKWPKSISPTKVMAVAAILSLAWGIVAHFLPQPEKVLIETKVSSDKFDPTIMTNSVEVSFEVSTSKNATPIHLKNLGRPQISTNACEESNATIDALVDAIDTLYEKECYEDAFKIAGIVYNMIVGRNCGSKKFHVLGPRLSFNMRKACAVLIEGNLNKGDYEMAGHLSPLLGIGDGPFPPYYHALTFVAMVRRYGRKIGVVLPSDWESEWWTKRLSGAEDDSQFRALEIIAQWGYLPPYALTDNSDTVKKISYRELFHLSRELITPVVEHDDQVPGGLVAKSWIGFGSYERFPLKEELMKQRKLIHNADCANTSHAVSAFPVVWYGDSIIYPFAWKFWSGHPRVRRDESTPWPAFPSTVQKTTPSDTQRQQ